MNREYLYRGKRKDNGEWIEGYLYRLSEKMNPFIMLINKCGESHEVIPETVGQYTGLTDKNDKKIFEGDILKYAKDGYSFLYVVLWSDEFAGWITVLSKEYTIYKKYYTTTIDVDGETMDCWDGWKEYYEIIGNIHDNKELLEVQE